MFLCLSFQVAQAAEGDVWLTPTNQNVGTSQNFDMEVHMDTGGKDLGAFNMYFDFDAAEVTIDLTNNDGIDRGSDTSSYTIMSNPDDIANGHFRFAGMTASNYANGSDVHLVTIHAQSTAGFTEGTSDLDIRVNELSNELGQALTGGTVTGGIITMMIQTYNLTNVTAAVNDWLQTGDAQSDVNSDGIVNTRDLGIMMSNWE